MAQSLPGYLAAIQDFRRARGRASLRETLSFLSGQSNRLLSYDEVRRSLRAVESPARQLREIPLDAIVGSVGRYNDFTREFLPRQDSDEQRWARVRLAMTGLDGVSPIEVYRLGDVYFVKDGNHRVSVARRLGNRYIQAYVIPVRSRVTLTAATGPDELIIKAEQADFLEHTELDVLRPDADLTVTAAGQYEKLLEHISVHRYFMGIDQQREVDHPEAVTHWYDSVYLPVVQSIRRNRLLEGFSGRTETDLYLWLADHRAGLEELLGWQLAPEAVAEGVAREAHLGPERPEDVLDRLTHDAGGERAEDEGSLVLVDDILVPLAGTEAGWQAFEQALLLARREGARLYGLHVVSEPEEQGLPQAQRVRDHFLWRCGEERVDGRFAFGVGHPADVVLQRAAWVDVVVASLTHPPRQRLVAGPGHGYLQLLHRSPRPLLAVSGPTTPLERLLLAYDASARSEEALFAAAYAAARWGSELVVLTVLELGRTGRRTLERAGATLERYGVEAILVEGRGGVADAILETAGSYGCDGILMGSYSYLRWLDALFGGVVEEVVRRTPLPVLVT